MRANGIKGNNLNIVTHLKRNQAYLMRTHFQDIRSSYNRMALSKIDALLDQLEFVNKEFKLINVANDFDRFVMSVNDLKSCYLNCMVSTLY